MIFGRVKIRIDRRMERQVILALDAGLNDIVDRIFEKSQDKVPVDEGMLKKSGGVDRQFLDKQITYLSPIAAYIEFGTRPHFPPIEPLQRWAKRQGEKNWKAAGYLIALKISKKGTEAQPFLRPAADETIPEIPTILKNAMRAYL